MLLSIAIFLAAIGATNPFGAPFINGDWVAGCDNLGNCSAASLPVRDARLGRDIDRAVEIKVEIDNGEAGLATVELSSTIDGAMRQGMKERRIAIDGKILPIDIHWREGNIRLAGRDAALLIARMTGARQLRLVDRDKTIAETSIDGFDAVAGYFRAFQASKKDLPDPPIKLPARDNWIAQRISGEQLEVLAQTDECRRYSKAYRAIENVQYYRIDGQNTLAITEVSCANYAGQNVPSRLFVIGDGERKWAYPAGFEAHPIDSLSLGPNYLPNVHWDAHKQILHAFQRTIGSDYCGAHAAFAWDGKIFRLVEYRLMPVCRGSTNFITTYRRATERAPWRPAPVVPATLPEPKRAK